MHACRSTLEDPTDALPSSQVGSERRFTARLDLTYRLLESLDLRAYAQGDLYRQAPDTTNHPSYAFGLSATYRF